MGEQKLEARNYKQDPANLPYRISGRGPQPGGFRPLIYNSVVLRYFLKMLFAENPENFFAFALLSLFKKSYRNIEKNGLKSNDSTKKVPRCSTAVLFNSANQCDQIV